MAQIPVNSGFNVMTRRGLFLNILYLLAPINLSGKQRRKTRQTKSPIANRPVELRGSSEQRIRQNKKAIDLGIGQIATNKELLTMAKSKVLVELRDGDYYYADRGITPARKLRKGRQMIVCPPRENKIFVRAYVGTYIDLLARDFFLEFHKRKKMKITSGTRSLEEQIIMRTKGSCYYTPYAAEANDPLEESLHVRAIAIDISRRVVIIVKNKLKEVPMSAEEIKWLRNRLIADKLNGVEFEIKNQEETVGLETEPIEERICYHIVVFPK